MEREDAKFVRKNNIVMVNDFFVPRTFQCQVTISRDRT